ncbi:MAG: 5-oxoprolinase subunit PxpB [Balneolaceae bacterium]
MELQSLQRKGAVWKCLRIGEHALLLEIDGQEEQLELVHEFTNALNRAEINGIQDVVPAYKTIGLIFDGSVLDHDKLIRKIETKLDSGNEYSKKSQLFKIPVCYDLGLDWDEVEKKTKLSKREIIEEHTSKDYTIAMMGFTPGFVFLNGLSERIWCSRRENPRVSIPKGSIGIGGKQTGFYSLESPGGWQIIGQTPISFFDSEKSPPSELGAGDKVLFYAIDELEFKEITLEQS